MDRLRVSRASLALRLTAARPLVHPSTRLSSAQRTEAGLRLSRHLPRGLRVALQSQAF